MPRSPRVSVKNRVYHVMNRGNGRLSIFDDDDDFHAFEAILAEACERYPDVQLYAFCVMPNHWHLLLEPTTDTAMSKFVGWLTITHTTRWQKYRNLVGEGHLYQGRYRSFMVQKGPKFFRVARYVERNALRAGFVKRAEDWRWGSLWRWKQGNAEQQRILSAWPNPPGRRPPGWVERVNRPESEGELDALRLHLKRGRPCGDADWQKTVIRQYGLESTLRPPGRPRKER